MDYAEGPVYSWILFGHPAYEFNSATSLFFLHIRLFCSRFPLLYLLLRDGPSLSRNTTVPSVNHPQKGARLKSA